MRRSFLTALAVTITVALALPPRPAHAAPEAPAPAPLPAAPSAVEKGETPGLEIPSLAAKDRILFNAGLDALVTGDLAQARNLFSLLAREGLTAEARTAALLIVDRLGGLEQRRAAGLVPPLRPPVVDMSDSKLPPRAAARPTEVSARAPVVAMTTLFGLALWGWTVPTMVGLGEGDNGRAFLGVYMLTATSSFVVPYLITARRPPTPAQANAIFYGGTRGAEWGLLLSNLAFGRAGGDLDDHDKAFAGSLFLGSLAGTVAGAYAPGWLDLTPGQVRTIAVLGDYGLLTGFALARLFKFHELGPVDTRDPNFDPFGDPPRSTQDKRARATSGAGLVGGLLGLGGGYFLAKARDNTWGDGEVMRVGGFLGVLAAGTLGAALDVEDNVAFAMLAAGGGAGLVGGDFFVRDKRYSPTEALMVDLAFVAGGLGGAGLVYLFTEAERATPYLLAATVGGAVGGGMVAWLAANRHGVDNAHGRAPTIALMPRFGFSGVDGVQVVGAF